MLAFATEIIEKSGVQKLDSGCEVMRINSESITQQYNSVLRLYVVFRYKIQAYN